MANTLGQSVNLNLASWLSLIGLKRTLSLKALRPITVWSWGQQTIAHYLLLYSKFYWKIAPKIHVLSGPLPEKFADPWCKVSWHIHLHFFFEHIPFRPLAIRLPFFFSLSLYDFLAKSNGFSLLSDNLVSALPLNLSLPWPTYPQLRDDLFCNPSPELRLKHTHVSYPHNRRHNDTLHVFSYFTFTIRF